MEKEQIKTIEKVKEINPATDKGNYIIQTISEGKVIKTAVAINCTVTIMSIGEQGMAADIK